MDEEGRYGLRKRRRLQSTEDTSLAELLGAVETASKILVFSGSGLSATSGMSTFSTPGGLYEQAQRKYKLADGKNLFTYSFYEKRKLDAQAFFAEIFLEAQQAKPAPGHLALSAISEAGRLLRHYTLNIDGLAEKVGMDIWHPENNPQGVTVEMHGNVHHLVCPECHKTVSVQGDLIEKLRASIAIPCSCGESDLRFKVMLYDDAEGECITPDDVMDLMEEDVQAADVILWVGISFQQSASTSYFRKARGWLQAAGRIDKVVQALINPSDEALWNLMSASSNQHELNVLEVLAASDKILPLMAQRVTTTADVA